jgi:hypothetical protein
VPPPNPQHPGNGWGRWIDPMEGAFAVLLPVTWGVQGGTYRVPPHGLPEHRFEARGDRDGLLRVRFGGQAWQFQDAPGMPAMGGMLGGLMQMFGGMTGMPGVEALPYCDAASFASSWLLPRAKQNLPDVTIERVEPRPDVEAIARQKVGMDAAARGLGGYQVDSSAVDVRARYTENGTSFAEILRVLTTRLRAPAMGWMTGTMPPTIWFGEIAFSFRAPHDRFAESEATLRAIAESMQRNPAWEAQQVQSDNARALAMQQQNMMRQRQISQTLSETSDIVSNGYWSRQQIHQEHEAGRQAMGSAPGGDWAHEWSNAMLGWEDRYDEAGNHFQVSAGHERLWRDNQNNVVVGNALTNPDPTWHELKKPGE